MKWESWREFWKWAGVDTSVRPYSGIDLAVAERAAVVSGVIEASQDPDSREWAHVAPGVDEQHARRAVRLIAAEAGLL